MADTLKQELIRRRLKQICGSIRSVQRQIRQDLLEGMPMNKRDTVRIRANKLGDAMKIIMIIYSDIYWEMEEDK